MCAGAPDAGVGVAGLEDGEGPVQELPGLVAGVRGALQELLQQRQAALEGRLPRQAAPDLRHGHGGLRGRPGGGERRSAWRGAAPGAGCSYESRWRSRPAVWSVSTVQRCCLPLGWPLPSLCSLSFATTVLCDIHRSFICLLPWSILYFEDNAHYWDQSSNQPDWLEQM